MWLSRHMQVLINALGRMWLSPLASVMTILVLAIAIALPLVLYKIATSVEQVTEDWTGTPSISLFLKESPGNEAEIAVEFGQKLLENPMIEDVEYVSSDQGLKTFSEIEGFAEAVDALPENPLPAVLVIHPATGDDIEATEKLAAQLELSKEVDAVVFDQQWLHRISAIVDLIKRGVIILAALMSAGIVLVIGNTVRTAIGQREREIEIIDQVGGTRAFIRRPFLYTTAIQCSFAVIVAWLISNGTLWLLSKPVKRLAILYETDFSIGWVNLGMILPILLGAVFLGWVATFATVTKYLGHLAPSQ